MKDEAMKKPIEIQLEISYVPLPPEKVETWRAGIRALLELLKKAEQTDRQETATDIAVGGSLKPDAAEKK